MSERSAAGVQRFTRERPCPICGGHDGAQRGQGERCFGYLDSTGGYARCTREERAGGLAVNDDETYSHRLTGPCRCGVEHGPPDPGPDGTSVEGTRHVIRALDGTPIAVHARKGTGAGKRIWWEQPDGSRGLDGTRSADILYGLERLADEDGGPVVLAEGEPAADALARLGYTALGSVTGAGSERAAKRISATVAAHLSGRTVYLFPDADTVGRAHMAANAQVLEAAGAQVLLLDWPEAPERGDAVDLLARLGADGARERMREIIAAASVAETTPDAGAAPPEPHSWTPLALDPATIEPPSPPSILAAEDGQGALLYEGMRHLLFGETEALKSWIAAAAAAELARAGRSTLWIDTDGMGRAALVERLGLLGLSDEEIRAQILYVAPDVPMDAEAAAILEAAAEGREVALVVIDAHDPALELQGLDPNSTADVQKFARLVVGIFHRRGIATLVPDHVARGGDGRDPIASQRKVSGFDVAIRAKVDGEPMTREHPAATVELFGRKDRGGWHDRRGHERRLGEITFDLRAVPPWRLVLGRGEQDERPSRPTVLMGRVSQWLERRAEPASLTGIEQSVAGKASGIRWAVDVLAREGYVEAVPGRRKGDSAYISRRPYQEGAEDEPVPEPVPPKTGEPVPTRPGIRPGENPHGERDAGNPSQPVPTRPESVPGLVREPVPNERPPRRGAWGDGFVGGTRGTPGRAP